MCIGNGNGIPALVVRWEEQSSKGFMWRDIGLGDWLFDFDQEEDLKKFESKVLEMADKPWLFKRKARTARKRVNNFQDKTRAVIKKSV